MILTYITLQELPDPDGFSKHLNDQESPLYISFQAYKQGNYQLALESLPKNQLPQIEEMIYSAMCFFNAQKFPEAFSLQFQSCDLIEKNLEKFTITMQITNLINLIQTCIALGQISQGLEFWNKAQSVDLKSLSPLDISYYSIVLNHLRSIFHEYNCEYQKAEELCKSTIEDMIAAHKDKVIEIFWMRFNFALLLMRISKNAPSKAIFEELNNITGAFDFPYDQQSILPIALGCVHRFLGNHREAKSLTQQGINALKVNPHKNQLYYCHGFNNIAWILKDEKNFIDGCSHIYQADEMYQAIIGTEHIIYAKVLNSLSLEDTRKSMNNTALGKLEQALGIYNRFLVSKHPDIAIIYHNQAVNYRSTYQNEKAIECYNLCLRNYLDLFGEKNYDVQLIYHNIGLMKYQIGEYSQAFKNYLKSTALTYQNPWTGVQTYQNLGFVFKEHTIPTEAMKYFMKSQLLRRHNYASNFQEKTSIFDADRIEAKFFRDQSL